MVAGEAELGTLMGDLREDAGDRLVGATIVHEPDLGIVVSLTEGSAVPAIDALAAGHREVLVCYVENRSRGELEALIAGHIDQWIAIRPDFVQGVYVGELSGAIEFDVLGSQKDADDYADLLTTRPEMRGIGVVLHPSEAPTIDMLRGGLPMASPLALQECTTGYSVLNSSSTYSGILTAEHCGPLPLTYGPFGTAGDATPLSNVASVRNDRADLRLLRRVGTTATPDFYAAGITDIRGVKSVARRADMPGSTLCHTGVTTGYTCGTVTTAGYIPVYPNACPGQTSSHTTCGPYWGKVTGSNLACSGGDSGGPWYLASKAFGIDKAGATTGDDPGDCVYAVFTAIGYAGIYLNTTVKIAP